MAESWRAARLVEYSSVDTIADGIAVRIPIPEVLADMAELVDDVLLVDDDELVRAMKLLHEHLGVVVEPSGAAGMAAVMRHTDRFRQLLLAIVLSGGNLSPEQCRRWRILTNSCVGA